MATKELGIFECEGFHVKEDMYNGYTIDTKYQKFANHKEEFESKLPEAVSKWRSKNIKAVWILVRTAHSGVIEICTKIGFDFHHAQPGYVMLTKWLPEHLENRIPGYANQYLGVAGFVVNDKNQLLVIQEKFNQIKKHWKLPGGLADKGEDLAETAKREVFEETGVEVEFISILGFRHLHQYRYGCSDWYFVCLMKPLSEDIKPCPHEIEGCKWIDIDEYLKEPDVTPMNRYLAECYKEGRMKHGGLSILPTDILSYDKKSYQKVYTVQHIRDQATESTLEEEQERSGST